MAAMEMKMPALELVVSRISLSIVHIQLRRSELPFLHMLFVLLLREKPPRPRLNGAK